ncbi:MAG: ABC transporter substrate-binding protein, partial [Rhodospirillaceae bacterium]|nr:ABC transporter substrate-binding protein [Rhodospirillaceae bacterium]
MSTAFNGRIFNAQALENQPLEIIWDGQVQAGGYQTIVAGTPRLEAARRFVAFATSTESLANVTGYISYAPLRRSSQALVDRHLEVGLEMAPHLPNWPANAARAVIEDPEWWADNLDDLNERFAAWLLSGG